jgi:hypothetical protein
MIVRILIVRFLATNTYLANSTKFLSRAFLRIIAKDEYERYRFMFQSEGLQLAKNLGWRRRIQIETLVL